MEIKKPKYLISISTIVLVAIMLIIPLTFFYLLDAKTSPNYSPGEENPNNFGIGEIFFSLAFAFVAVTFLLWLKSFMTTKPYLGLIVGLIVLGVFAFSTFFKFRGPFTTTFVILTSLIVLAYLGMYFFRYRKQYSTSKVVKDEFDDSL